MDWPVGVYEYSKQHKPTLVEKKHVIMNKFMKRPKPQFTNLTLGLS